MALSAEGSGEITTKALTVPPGSKALEVNADADGGKVQAELLTRDGNVIDGFPKEDCAPLSDDELHWRVSWQSGDISQPKGGVRIRLYLENSKLYSYTFLGD